MHPSGRPVTCRCLLLAAALAIAGCAGRGKEAVTSRPAPRSGVQGTVEFGPQCPVERVDQPCPPKPGPADIRLERPDGGLQAAGQAGPDGRFQIDAPAGRYVVKGQGLGRGPFGHCQPVDAVVNSGSYFSVTLSCDTGIR